MVAAIYLNVSGYKAMQSDISIGYPSLITIYSFLENMFLQLGEKFNGSFHYFIRSFKYTQVFQRSALSLDRGFTSAVKENYKANTEICLVVETTSRESDILEVLKSMNLSKGFIHPTVALFSEEELAIKSLIPMYSFRFIEQVDIIDQLMREQDKTLMISGYKFVSAEYDDFVEKHGYSKTRFAVPIYSIMELVPVRNNNIGELTKFQYTNDEEKILIRG